MKKRKKRIAIAAVSLIFVGTAMAGEDAPEEPKKLEEMVVTGTRTERLLGEVPVRTEVLEYEDIKKSGATQLYDILDKRMIPGVWVETSCNNCNFAGIRMQGLKSGYTLVLIDGQPIYSGLAGVYGLRQTPSENIERIEVVKGAGSALYGASALGGVINIITREPVEDEPQINATVTYGEDDTVETLLSASMREGNLAAIVTAQSHENDYVDENGDGYTDKIERDTENIGIKTHYYLLEDSQRLTAFYRTMSSFRRGGYIPGGHVRKDGTLTRGIDDALDPDAEHITTDRDEYGLGYRGIFPSDGIMNLDFVGTRHERDATNGERPFHSKEDIWLMDGKFSQPLGEVHVATIGATYKEEDLEQVINWDAAPPRTSKTTGIYAQDEIDLWSATHLVLGGRYDDVKTSLISDDSVNPRIALKQDLGRTLSVRGSWGQGFKVPYLFAEDLHLCSAAPILYMDPQLEPEESTSYTLGAEFALEKLQADVNLFRTDIKDKISMIFGGGQIPEGFDAMYVNSEDAYTQGVEGNARLDITDECSLNSGISFIDARYEEPRDPEFPDSEYIMRVPEFSATLGLDYELAELGIVANVSGRYIGRQYVEKELAKPIGSQDAGYHIDHVKGYDVYDIRIEKKLRDGRFSIFAGVDNVFDEVQEPIYNAEQEDTAAYIYAPLTGRYLYCGIEMAL